MDLLHSTYAFDTTATPPVYVKHDFYLDDGGNIQHVINNIPRARVPRKSWEEYADKWPCMETAIHEAFESVAMIDIQTDNPQLADK